jgi:hypothetical protein
MAKRHFMPTERKAVKRKYRPKKRIRSTIKRAGGLSGVDSVASGNLAALMRARERKRRNRAARGIAV